MAALLFVALSGVYFSLSPGTAAQMGYVAEEMRSGESVLAIVHAWLTRVPAPPMQWSRHGLPPVLLDLPFLLLGKVVASADFVLSIQPVLLTAGLAAVLFLWLSELVSAGRSLLIALTGAFCTMLWPYVYIGLETKQSFFVLLSAYLALSGRGVAGWKRTTLFALSCALAVSVKSTGIVLVPAIAYLAYIQFEPDWRKRRPQILTFLAIVGTLWLIGNLSRHPYWAALGGAWVNLKFWLIDSPFTYFINLIGIFGSPTKGFFVYCPVLLLSLYALPQAFRTHRKIAIFTLLLIGGMVAQLATLRSPTDETWGCRYLHTTIAPLLLCIGVASPVLRWRRELPLLALASIGLVISFLGAFYYYGQTHAATMNAGQNTAEWLLGDSIWNPIRFHARLFGAWVAGNDTPIPWTPSHTWMYDPPPGAPPWKTLDLRAYSQPQSVMLRLWRAPKQGAQLLTFAMYLSALIAGLLLLLLAVIATMKEEQPEAPREFAKPSRAGAS